MIKIKEILRSYKNSQQEIIGGEFSVGIHQTLDKNLQLIH